MMRDHKKTVQFTACTTYLERNSEVEVAANIWFTVVGLLMQ